MASWLQKLLGLPDQKEGRGRSLTVRNGSGSMVPQNLSKIPLPRSKSGKIPNASLVYGVTAILLFLVSVYHLFTGRWLTGILVMFLAFCFVGFAWHIAKYAE